MTMNKGEEGGCRVQTAEQAKRIKLIGSGIPALNIFGGEACKSCSPVL